MKKFTKHMLALSVVVGVAAGGFVQTAVAQVDDWPNRTVRLIVPYGPGASNDLSTRLFANFLSQKFDQTFVVENKPGANGLIAGRAVSRVEPDGYTLLEHNNNISSLSGGGKVDFDPNADLTPIGLFFQVPNALIVPTSSGINSIDELIAYAKENPNDTFFGTGSYGAQQHLQHMDFALKADINIQPIVFQNGTEILNDLAAGRLQLGLSSVASAAGLIAAGKIKVLAYAGEPSPTIEPKASTVKEQGVDFEAPIWLGMFGPPGMDKGLREKINDLMFEAVRSDEFKQFIEKTGGTPSSMSTDEFEKLVADTTDNVNFLYEVTGIVPE